MRRRWRTRYVRRTCSAAPYTRDRGYGGSRLPGYAMSGDGVICALQAPDRFNNIHKDYTDCVGMRYGFVVGMPADGGFVIPQDDLARTLEKVGRECRV